MTEETPPWEAPAALELYYDGEVRAINRGGYVARLVIPFDDMPIWRAMVADWTPDAPLSLAVARIEKPSKTFDPKAKEWIVPDGTP